MNFLQGDEYVINGGKIWITNACEADVFLVYAKVEYLLYLSEALFSSVGFDSTSLMTYQLPLAWQLVLM